MSGPTVVNRQMVLAQRPLGMADQDTVRLETSAVPEPGPQEALVRVRYLSIDPTIRTWMNDAPGYLPPIELGQVIRGGGIGEVVQSGTSHYRKGDLVFGMTGWQDFAVAGPHNPMTVLPQDVPPGAAMSVFGVTGMTAYFGLIEVGSVAEGDTVVVSAAAGATGSVVGQVARIKGAGTVVGVAGSYRKCVWIVDELGFDAAVDYRGEDVATALRRHCPDGIDLYFDNVGGEILDACLGQLAMGARVVVCGAISMYNKAEPPPGPRNYINLLLKRARMQGFLVLDYVDRFPEAQLQMAQWVQEGRVKWSEHVIHGLERSTEALNLLFTGENTGKVIVEL
jgi:NADPH-dependent curcumin reductase